MGQDSWADKTYGKLSTPLNGIEAQMIYLSKKLQKKYNDNDIFILALRESEWFMDRVKEASTYYGYIFHKTEMVDAVFAYIKGELEWHGLGIFEDDELEYIGNPDTIEDVSDDDIYKIIYRHFKNDSIWDILNPEDGKYDVIEIDGEKYFVVFW